MIFIIIWLIGWLWTSIFFYLGTIDTAKRENVLYGQEKVLIISLIVCSLFWPIVALTMATSFFIMFFRKMFKHPQDGV